MMENKLPPIMIQNQYIKDLSMEIPHAPEIFKKMQGKNPDVHVDVNIEAKKIEDHMFDVVLAIAVNGDIEKEKAFILELSYAAVVSLNIPAEHEEPVLMVEIPHMIYPFVRQIVAQTMINAGLPALMLNPLDFMGMYQAKKAKKQ